MFMIVTMALRLLSKKKHESFQFIINMESEITANIDLTIVQSLVDSSCLCKMHYNKTSLLFNAFFMFFVDITG